MIPIKAEAAWRGHSDCEQCGIKDVVLFGDLQEEDFKLIHRPIDDIEYPSAGVLFHQQDEAKAIFTLRSGLVKLTRLLPDGTERIVRVLRKGDVIGLEATAGKHYDTGAYALTPARVCRIPVDVILRLSTESPRLHQRLMQKWTHQLHEADDWISELAHGTARQRVIRLILKLQIPQTAPQLSQDTQAMLFSRDEMAMMLGLTVETISRIIASLTRAQSIERLDKIGRLYRIDIKKLQQELDT